MKWWNISISGYGDFQYWGTREQADERAGHKAQWEGGKATVREANDSEAAEGADHIRWRKENGYPLERWEREALNLAGYHYGPCGCDGYVEIGVDVADKCEHGNEIQWH